MRWIHRDRFKPVSHPVFKGLAGLLFLLGLFLLGPRIDLGYQLRPLHLPADLSRYFQRAEAHYPDLTPGTEKKIVWAGKPGQRTPYALVYFHGFSATRQEVSPLCENLAQRLQANLFLTRFSGHGRSENGRNGEAMAEASVDAWLNDAHEALAVGKRLGQQTILIGVSTGASIATWAAAQQRYPELAALVLISPNYGLANPQGQVIGWPWGGPLIRLVLGKERIWQPTSPSEARYWTWRYPVEALLPMMGVIQLLQAQDLGQVQAPALLIYAPQDTVVSTSAIQTAFARLGSRQKVLLPFEQADDPEQHVLAGRIKSPKATPLVEAKILDFLKGVLK